MRVRDTSGHTFIVRIWIEPREGADRTSEWRGEIRHVPSGRTVYFRRLESIGERVSRLLNDLASS